MSTSLDEKINRRIIWKNGAQEKLFIHPQNISGITLDRVFTPVTERTMLKLNC